MSIAHRTVRTSDGVALAVRDTGGEGTPLVLLHGWSQTQEMFRHQMRGLGARRVVSIDQRGHGDSEKPGRGYRIARLAADLRDVLDELDVAEADVLGWSMGASVIWSYIELFGADRLRNLVFVDQPAAVVAQEWMDAAEREHAGSILPVDGLGALAAAIAGPGGDDAARAFVRGMFTGRVDDRLWTFVAGEIAKTPREAAAALLFDHGAQDWRDVLPAIDRRTLVIGCDGSHVSPLSQQYVASRIPGAQVHIFPRDVASSHFPFLENPDAFNGVLTAFLDAPVDSCDNSPGR